MIIAALALSVLSVVVSGYSLAMQRRAARARRETGRLRQQRPASQGFLDGLAQPVVHVDGALTEAVLAKLREDLRRALYRRA